MHGRRDTGAVQAGIFMSGPRAHPGQRWSAESAQPQHCIDDSGMAAKPCDSRFVTEVTLRRCLPATQVAVP